MTTMIADWVPLELGFGTQVSDTFEGFEIDEAAAAAAAFAAATFSTL